MEGYVEGSIVSKCGGKEIDFRSGLGGRALYS